MPSAASTRETGRYWDDTKHYIEAAWLTDAERQQVYEDNICRVYPRLAAR